MIEPQPETDIQCPQCAASWGVYVSDDAVFDRCPCCTCRQFYAAKDFNQALGCLIMGFGIVLVPWTFGLSLPVFAFVDWLLYRRVPAVICCYRCGSEFRGFSSTKDFKPFMHHIGLKYDKYR
ncbi:MAG: hypothetical protein JNN05_09345 [Candidatus Omnitrophica bacterium]|nr:hypothetical protein [Candidatus Omnitrophota bacterium]